MKKLMIIGASALQLPAILAAKEMGLYVGVIDYNPDAIGIKYADEYFNVSTIDEEGVYLATKEFGADGIITLATDMPIRALAYTCEKLGLNGIDYETAIRATDKEMMIKAFENAQVSHPWYYTIDDINNIPVETVFPCITKPVDNSGSRGVMYVDNLLQLEESILYSSQNGRSGKVIVEEFMQGPEVSVEVIVVNKQVNILQITDKLTTGSPHFVEMGHSQPSQLSDEIQKSIRLLAKQAIDAIGINNGPVHVEMIITKEGPKMVELGARMGGDKITTHLVPLSTGIDMVKATINLALGEDPVIDEKYCKGATIRYFEAKKGVIKKIDGVKDAYLIQGVQEISFSKEIGEEICEIDSSAARIGCVLAQGDTAQDAINIANRAINQISIEIKE